MVFTIYIGYGITRLANCRGVTVALFIKPADEYLAISNGHGGRYGKRIALRKTVVVLIFKILIPRDQVGRGATRPRCTRDRQEITRLALVLFIANNDRIVTVTERYFTALINRGISLYRDGLFRDLVATHTAARLVGMHCLPCIGIITAHIFDRIVAGERVVVEHDFRIGASSSRHGLVGIGIDFVSVNIFRAFGDQLPFFQASYGLGVEQPVCSLVDILHRNRLVLRHVFRIVFHVGRSAYREAHRAARNALVVIPAIKLVGNAVVLHGWRKLLSSFWNRNTIAVKAIRLGIDHGVARTAWIPHVEFSSDGRFGNNFNRAVEMIVSRFRNLVRVQDDFFHVIFVRNAGLIFIGLEQRVPIGTITRKHQPIIGRRAKPARP